ncbi:MAG: leucyl aminopeptidase [Ignavibacteriae bacterium]|nr:leucyl aminopeptidase [Ignavibacteriota bacterium]
MNLSFQTSSLKSVKADAVVYFIEESKTTFKKRIAELRKLFGKRIDHIIELENFTGKDSESLSILTEGKLASPRLLLIGLGDEKKLTIEKFRRAAARSAKQAKGMKLKHVAMVLPEASETITDVELAKALAEGAYLSLYKYDKYLTENKEKKNVAQLTLVSEKKEIEKEINKVLREVKFVCEAVYLTRNLENAPGNELYPESLAQIAKESAQKFGYRCTVWDKKKIQEMKFGGLLAVNSGSERPPRFIILEHNAGKKNLETIVLVGKGITFDAGGISIKPASGMGEMKMDMSGAAAVIGTMEAVARLKVPVHVIGLIPSTENLLGGAAMRPGDIITHYGGKTSEVDNTDAEGRLVLADALAYASIYKPKAVIDLATLTGACVVALGHYATGMMGNDDELMSKLKTAGEATYERVWQLPMYDEYEKLIKSDVADVKNVGGRWAGAITAGFFLKKFIGKYNWVHLDIAGTAILEEDLPYAPKGGSGVGVRLLVEMLKGWKTK